MRFFTVELKDNFKALADMPQGTLNCYIPEASVEIDPNVRRPSVLICPGGAYMYCSWREAEPIALYYVSKGFNAFVLFYAVAPAKYPAPQVQAMAAVELIRRNAEQWNCSGKVCCMGFSAGGHLAACTANADLALAEKYGLGDVRPDASILCYPVISSGEYAHKGSFDALCSSAAQADALSAEKLVNGDTPPTFLWHTSNDACVSVVNSLLYAQALAVHGVKFELHVFPDGVHGLACCNKTSGVQDYFINPTCEQWLEQSVRWLREIGLE